MARRWPEDEPEQDEAAEGGRLGHGEDPLDHLAGPDAARIEPGQDDDAGDGQQLGGRDLQAEDRGQDVPLAEPGMRRPVNLAKATATAAIVRS